MNRNLVIAGIGAVVGGAIAYISTRIFYENKIEKIQENHAKDLEEVRAIYKTFHDETIKKADEIARTPKIVDCNDVDKAIEYVSSLGYDVPEPDEGYTEEEADATVYLIDESEFGVLEHVNTETLIYFEDEVLTYSDYTLKPEPQVFRNAGVFEALADSAEDVVYVRNRLDNCDYEILYDIRNFRDDVLPTLASPNED